MKQQFKCLILFCVLLFSTINVFGQYCNTATTNIAITPTTTSQNTALYNNGRRAFNFVATAGVCYQFSTCGLSSQDTYLRLYSTGTGGTVLAFNDDDCGLQSTINWTCTTTGTYSVLLTRWVCGNLSGNARMSYRITPCSPPSCTTTTPAGNTCATATPICDFNGYCGNTSSTYTVNTWGSLTSTFCGSIENNSFLSFVAAATTVSLDVWVQNCAVGYGIQFMVFTSNGNCSGAVTSYVCDNQMLPGYSTITAPGLTIGTTYYLMIDGFNGDVCDYIIGASSSSGILLPVALNTNAVAICSGASTTLTASGGNGTYTWSPATGLSATTGATVIASPTVSTTYTVTSTAGNPACPTASTEQVVVTVNSLNTISAGINRTTCINTAITPITLATTGATGATVTGLPAGVTGSWAGNVVTISGTPTTTVGSPFTYTVYTTGGCTQATTTGTITVTPLTTPTFTAVGPYCSGAVIPALSLTSNNSIAGTWSPAISNTATGTYTFTPTAGLCAPTQTLIITITPNTTPTFTAVGPYCS